MHPQPAPLLWRRKVWRSSVRSASATRKRLTPTTMVPAGAVLLVCFIASMFIWIQCARKKQRPLRKTGQSAESLLKVPLDSGSKMTPVSKVSAAHKEDKKDEAKGDKSKEEKLEDKKDKKKEGEKKETGEKPKESKKKESAEKKTEGSKEKASDKDKDKGKEKEKEKGKSPNTPNKDKKTPAENKAKSTPSKDDVMPVEATQPGDSNGNGSKKTQVPSSFKSEKTQSMTEDGNEDQGE